MWGTDLNKVENDFGKLYFDYLMKSLAPFLKSNHLKKSDNKIYLTEKSIFISDHIFSALLKV
jgi:oxygen-independent coproporphyrinogen-3 oxidase